jgi:hypothetical protein
MSKPPSPLVATITSQKSFNISFRTMMFSRESSMMATVCRRAQILSGCMMIFSYA